MTKQQFDFIVDVTQVLIWQYNDAEKLQAIIQNKQNWIDLNVRDFWQNWFDNVFNLNTANDFGLQVWAQILGVVFTPDKEIPVQFFGFNPDAQNFNNGGFYPSLDSILTLEQKRTVLKLRYKYMTAKGTIDDINSAVSSIFPTAKALEYFNMSIDVEYIGIPTRQEEYMINNFNIVPKPAAVELNYKFILTYWVDESSSVWVDENNSVWAESYA